MSFLPPSEVTPAAPTSTVAARPRARVNLAKATARTRKPAATAAAASKRKRDSSDEEDEEEEEDEEVENTSDGTNAPSAASSSSSSNNQITLTGTSHSLSLAPTAAANGIAANRKKKLSGLFPKSKIKALMYEDEEVSKMSAVVPLMVSRCVEHFISDLMQSAETQAKVDREKNDQSIINFQGKRTLISAQQIKRAILTNPKYDFLVDIASSVSDSPASAAAASAASTLASSAKQKPVPKKQRVEDDESDEEEEQDQQQQQQNQNKSHSSIFQTAAVSHPISAYLTEENDLAGF